MLLLKDGSFSLWRYFSVRLSACLSDSHTHSVHLFINLFRSIILYLSFWLSTYISQPHTSFSPYTSLSFILFLPIFLFAGYPSYKVMSFPHIAVIDPRTGASIWTYTKKISEEMFAEKLMDFLGCHPYPDGKYRLKEEGRRGDGRGDWEMI